MLKVARSPSNGFGEHLRASGTLLVVEAMADMITLCSQEVRIPMATSMAETRSPQHSLFCVLRRLALSAPVALSRPNKRDQPARFIHLLIAFSHHFAAVAGDSISFEVNACLSKTP